MADFMTCTVDFDTIDPASLVVSDAQMTRYSACVGFIDNVLDILMSRGAKLDDLIEPCVDWGMGHLAAVVWGPAFFVFLIFAAIPLCVTRCCCKRQCCPPKEEYVDSGYPCEGMAGYGIVSIAWGCMWLLLTVLAVYFPLAMMSLGDNVDQWSCVAEETFGLFDDFVAEGQATVHDAVSYVLDQVALIVTEVNSVLNTLDNATLTVNATLVQIDEGVAAGCASIVASADYQTLLTLSAGATIGFNCDAISVGNAPQEYLSELESMISNVRLQIADVVVEVNDSLLAVQDEIDDVVSDLTAVVDMLWDSNAVVESFIPVLHPQGGPLTETQLVDLVTDFYGPLGASALTLTYLGVLFWLLGAAVLWAIKRKAEEHRGQHDRRGEVTSGCCGRSMTILGCTCAYMSATGLCLGLILASAAAVFTSDVATAFYATPFDLATAFTVVNKLASWITGSDGVQGTPEEFAATVGECFFADGRATAVFELFGFDVEQLVVDMADGVGTVNITDYGNITAQVEEAEAALDSATGTLNSDRYTADQLAAADAAADYCCDYQTLFSIFVPDECTGTGTSTTCDECTTLVPPCDPTTLCTPTAGTLAEECNVIAKAARNVMDAQNALVEEQVGQVGTLDVLLEGIAAENYDAELQTTIDSVLAGLPDGVLAIIDTLTCGVLGEIWFGVYEALLAPINSGLASVTASLGLLIFFTILVVFVQIPLDVRVGNAGIDTDVLASSPKHSGHRVMQASDVAIEMTTSPTAVAQTTVGPAARAMVKARAEAYNVT